MNLVLSQLLPDATEDLPLADALLVLDGIAKGAKKAMRELAEAETDSQARAVMNKLTRAELDARSRRTMQPSRPYSSVDDGDVSVRTISGGAPGLGKRS